MKIHLLAAGVLGVIAIGTVVAQPLVQPSPVAGPRAVVAPPAPGQDKMYAPSAKGQHGASPPHYQTQAQDGPAANGELSGEVQQFLLNPHGEVDGVLLISGSLVRFPPHMSEQMVRAVSPGDTIQALGRSEPNGHDLKAYRIVNRNGGATVVESPKEWTGHRDGRHRRHAAMQPMNAQGTVQRLLTGRHGETHGVILDDGVIVRFPKHMHYAGRSVQVGQPFGATGYGSRNRYGAAMEAETIDGMAAGTRHYSGPPRK